MIVVDVYLIHRLFDWENIMRPREDNQAGEESEEVIKELRDVGQQLALAFNQEGSVLAVGGEVKKALRFFNSLLNNSERNLKVVLNAFLF